VLLGAYLIKAVQTLKSLIVQ